MPVFRVWAPAPVDAQTEDWAPPSGGAQCLGACQVRRPDRAESGHLLKAAPRQQRPERGSQRLRRGSKRPRKGFKGSGPRVRVSGGSRGVRSSPKSTRRERRVGLGRQTRGDTPDFLREKNSGYHKEGKYAISNIQSDHEGEFKNNEFDQFCKTHGINHRYSSPRTPEQNRVVKRRNKTLVEMARTMLIESKLPKKF